MKFDELDQRMRVYETVRDQSALPGVYLVARIDGRSFTRLTKDTMDFKRPFDERFRDAMVATVEHLMSCGFRVLYGYTQSDEISLLFGRDENSFGRSIRKWISILAGEASGTFSVRLGHPAAFDARLIELPTEQTVIDYFRWRNEDAHRNALNAHCYWMLRNQGLDAGAAHDRVAGLSVAEKNELLFQSGVNFNDLPLWQRRGVGIVWEDYEKVGTNLKTGEPVSGTRRRLRPIYELPMREEYSAFVAKVLPPASS
jgi:tRNA(His) guanylyltransferase